MPPCSAARISSTCTGSKIQGQSVRTTSSNVDLVGAYTVQDSDGRLYVLLFNKDLAAQTVHVNVANLALQAIQLYRFTGASALGPAGTITPSSGSFDAVLPARSATLAVVVGSSITPTLASLIQADASPGLVKLRWELGQGNQAQVERRTLDTDWQAVAMKDVDSARQITYEDHSVVAGTKYGYRLRLGAVGAAPTAGEVWLDVPGQYEFSLSGVQPTPSAAAARSPRYSSRVSHRRCRRCRSSPPIGLRFCGARGYL